MNLLKVQDALKNASDQQLMALMQAPDSTAPSYLVLSEIRRRKDMRAKQAPEGASNRTVAEDLTAPQEPVGIQGLQGQDSMDPDGVDAADGGVQGMAAGGLASLRRYREGGVVRMQAGGDIMGDIPFPTSNYEDMTIPPSFQPPANQAGQSLPMVRSFQRTGNDLRLRGAQREAQAAIRANPSARTDAGLFDRIAGQYGVSADDLRQSVLGPTPVPTQTPGGVGAIGADAPMRPQAGELGGPTGVQYERSIGPEPSGIQYDAAIGPQPPQGQGQQGQPGQGQQGQGQPRTAGGDGGAPGIEGLRNAPAAMPEGGQLPTMAELMRQNAALFPDGMGSIRDRMREERVDPAARRSEAVNMALIEAGLRIAGSRNPSLIGAIGEGALPAVQSYGQQLGQIRAEQRQARQDDLELAKQETNRQFAVGQISAAEYRSRMDNINANLRINAQERGANARLAASESAADRRAAAQAAASEASDLRRGLVTPEQYARMTPEQRANLQELRAIGRPADTGNAQSVLNRTLAEIERLEGELRDTQTAPSQTTGIFGSANPRFAEWERNRASVQERLQAARNRARDLENIVITGRGGSGAGGSASGTTNLPSGARIENGRYVPAGG